MFMEITGIDLFDLNVGMGGYLIKIGIWHVLR